MTDKEIAKDIVIAAIENGLVIRLVNDNEGTAKLVAEFYDIVFNGVVDSYNEKLSKLS